MKNHEDLVLCNFIVSTLEKIGHFTLLLIIIIGIMQCSTRSDDNTLIKKHLEFCEEKLNTTSPTTPSK